MLHRQTGALSLYGVAIFSIVFAAAAMAALYSMRYERNLFAEGSAKVASWFGSASHGVADAAKKTMSGEDGAMRSCVINGKKVISNAECSAKDPNSKVIAIHDTKGFEAPKVPVAPKAEATSNPVLDKIIEKQLQ